MPDLDHSVNALTHMDRGFAESEYRVWAFTLMRKHPGQCSEMEVQLRAKEAMTNVEVVKALGRLKGRLGDAVLVPHRQGRLTAHITILGERVSIYAYLALGRDDISPLTEGISVEMVSVGREIQDEVIRWAEEAGFEVVDAAADGEVQVTFAFPNRDRGVRSTHRYFTPIPLQSIAKNYTQEILGDSEKALRAMRRTKSGLVVLNGLPGTGKSYLIRAFLSELQGYRDAVVCSPPSIFLQNAGLLMEASAPHKRSVVVLEDVGDLIEFDAASRRVDETANLLNYTEGLMSLLADSIVLVTFNYEVAKVNPALLREGRCLAHIQTRPLEHEHAQRLVGFPIPDQRYTLAEVYAIKEIGKAEARKEGSAWTSALLRP